MKIKIISTLLFVVLCFACNPERENYSAEMVTKPESEMAFDIAKWTTQEGKDYPYRKKMVNDILYNDTIRNLQKDQILTLLGEPSFYRKDTNYLYYMINQKRLGPWPLHTTSLVIKFSENKVEWIKIHE
jgi:outer membrane protein assembly factor BamE (lipoprotein component of BamABCDE complex)